MAGWFGVAVTALVATRINKVKLRQVRLELGLITTSVESAITVYIQTTQPGHPSVDKRKGIGDGFGDCWEEMASSA